MGRFEHEAAAVEPRSGMVYLTEDKDRSLIYRFRPNVPGQLAQGGKLQALVVTDQPALDTRNWSSPHDIRAGEWHEVRWLDLEDVDSDDNDLRLRGYAAGAARFARGEGICTADGSLFFTCTSGGQQRLGQIFQYEPSPFEGTNNEYEQPGKMRLLVELNRDSVLQNCDNLTMSPWGDLVVCEDNTDHAGLICVRPNGEQYMLADNAYSDSELAGVCFAPDGKTLFVNIQYAGLTLAITGPWPGRTN
jgi:secreted PhoX family phosphatase